MLVFVIPVRHPCSVPDWEPVRERLAETAASVSRQTSPDWRCVVVAEERADLPDLPPGVGVVRVDLPPPPLPAKVEDPAGYHDRIRGDKGRRVLAGLAGMRPTDHLMVVDYDDWVSRRLAEVVAADGGGSGWFLRHGWLYDGGPERYLHDDFTTVCGTSLILRRDAIDIPPDLSAAGEATVRRHLGSHRFQVGDLAARRTPLAPLPFPGAVYRVGVTGSASGTGAVRQAVLPARPLLCPRTYVRNRRRLSPVDPAFFAEFGITRRQ